MAKIEKTETIDNKENVTTEEASNAVPVDNKLISQMLERLEKMEAENAKLKASKENSILKGKERVSGSIKANYKLWGGIPVLSYKSTKKDINKPLTYKDAYGNYVSNHYLDLHCADGKIYKVEVNEFGNGFTRSEKQDVYDDKGNKLVMEKGKFVGTPPMAYTFKTEEYGDITVLPNLIN